jgi:hypothetical protein
MLLASLLVAVVLLVAPMHAGAEAAATEGRAPLAPQHKRLLRGAGGGGGGGDAVPPAGDRELACLASGSRCHMAFECPSCCVPACNFGGTYGTCGTCDAAGKWLDGVQCSASTTCLTSCLNPGTYWYSKLSTACGTEPRWADGKACTVGTSCTVCQNPATYWYTKARTVCGTEPKLADGKVCTVGATCTVCQNPATFWPSKNATACGTQP